jgi:hypothetical protein
MQRATLADPPERHRCVALYAFARGRSGTVSCASNRERSEFIDERQPTEMRRAITALAVLAFVATACGGGGGVTAAAWAAQGNDLCLKLATADATGRATLGASPTPADLTTYIQATYVPEANETYRAIGALPRPKDKATDIDALLTDVLAEISLIQYDPVGGGNKVNQAQLVSRLRDIGLTSCGTGFAGVVDKQSFLAEADGICSNLHPQIDSAAKEQKIYETATKEQRAAFVRNYIIPLYRETLDKVVALGYPPADATLLAGIVSDSRAYYDALDKDPESFFSEPDSVKALHERWRAYGVTTCG